MSTAAVVRADSGGGVEDYPLAAIFPLLAGEPFNELVADIAANGLREPIALFGGKILDGRNRYRACVAAGVEPSFSEYTGTDPVAFVISLNLRRRHLDESQRAMVAARLANLGHGVRSDRAANLPVLVAPVTQAEAATLLNVSERTVRAAKSVQEQGAPNLVDAVERGEVSVSAAADVATLPQARQIEIVAAGEPEILVAAKQVRAARTIRTGEDEWYTPSKYIEAARRVMGAIDLDPASSHRAQETVRAARYFTKENDGLKQEWAGRVWLNPPYAQPLIGRFVSKLVAERRAGRVTAAIMLTHNCTDTSWFHEAAGVADAICFTRGRVKFLCRGAALGGSPTQGQAFFYFGADVEAFYAEFSAEGLIMLPRRRADGGGR